MKRTYSKEFKMQACRLVEDEHIKVSIVAKQLGIGKETLHRYIRLTYLIPELLKMVDDKIIALTPAVELSYLTNDKQRTLLNEIKYAHPTPSILEAQRLRDFSKQGRLNADVIYAVMSEEKANQKEQIHFPKAEIQKYFPKSHTGKDMQNTILNLPKKWQR